MANVLLYIIAATAIVFQSQAQAVSPNLELVKANWRKTQQVPVSDWLIQKAIVYETTIKLNGQWDDIVYQAENNPQSFPAREHLNRLFTLGLVSRWAQNPNIRQSAANAFALGAKYWAAHTPVMINGWYNEIDAPNYLGLSALLASDAIDMDTKSTIVTYIKSVAAWPMLNFAGKPATGMNLLLKAKGQMIAGLLSNDAAYYQWAEYQFLSATSVSINEGIQPDFSFHQHGPQLYSGGYGRATLVEAAATLVITAPKSDFAQARISDLSSFLTDGVCWFIYNGQWDFNSVGREIVRDSLRDTDISIAARSILAVATTRSNDLAAIVEQSSATGMLPFRAGCKYFWLSDTSVFRGRDWYASIHSASSRTFGSESGNGENVLGYHLGSGSTCFMRTGTEYAGIFPLWNWTLVPGVTCIYQDPEQLPLINWGAGSSGGSSFVGGLATTSCGISAMQLARGGVSAKKAWFYQNNRLVCLGTDISSTGTTGPVVTSVDQCWAGGTPQVNSIPILSGTTRVLSGTNRVQIENNGFSYVFPYGGTIHLNRMYRSAPWTRINLGAGTTKIASGETFRLWIEHGSAISNASYAYIVSTSTAQQTLVPQTTVGASLSINGVIDPLIVSNTSQLQAVLSSDQSILQCVFWRAGRAVVPGWLQIETDTPVIVQLTRKAAGLTLVAQLPPQDIRTIQFRLTPIDANAMPVGISKVVSVPFKGGEQKGAPMTVSIPVF